MWEKYGQVLNDPVRNLNVRFAFQDGNITEIEASPRYHDFNVILANFMINSQPSPYKIQFRWLVYANRITYFELL